MTADDDCGGGGIFQSYLNALMGVPTANFLGMVAGIISIAAFLPYISSILKGSTRPHRMTWLIWTVLGFVIAFSYHSIGARDTFWAAASYALGPLIVCVLSLRYGEGGWTRFDLLCLAAAASSIIAWKMTGSPRVGLAMSVLADACGALPTLKKSYYRPEHENRTAWTIGFLGAFVNLFAISNWANLQISTYPIYMFVNTGLIAAAVWFSPWRGYRDWAPKGKPHFGEHLTLDGYGGSPALLDDDVCILNCIYSVIDQLGMNMLADPCIYRAPDNQIKDPGGWSAFVVIAESHVSIHTFPARRFISADIYTCKAGLPLGQVEECFISAFKLRSIETNYLKRGTRYPDFDVAPEFSVK